MTNAMDIFAAYESNVRFYSRNFPVVFHKAYGCFLESEDGKKYIDFFCGSGALNYGHNHPIVKEALMKYLREDGIVHSLDMATLAKRNFMHDFYQRILLPRNMNYKLQFCSPTGTNAVEAAMKLARKVTKRQNIIAFTNAFHGVSLGSLAITGSASKRAAAGVGLHYTTFMPFAGYLGDEIDTVAYIDRYLSDPSSGVDAPAAFVLETVQAEGGVNVASVKWLQALQVLAKKHQSLLIIDDIQVGCGRTGQFFSFEEADLSPDIVCLSKSLSAYGLPLSIVLMKPELDVWAAGEHNGTFRGHNLAFVTAGAGLQIWEDISFQTTLAANIHYLQKRLANFVSQHQDRVQLYGRGMILGLRFNDPHVAVSVARHCFDLGLIIETAGPQDEVIKLLPALNIDQEYLCQGLDTLLHCVNLSLVSQESHA